MPRETLNLFVVQQQLQWRGRAYDPQLRRFLGTYRVARSDRRLCLSMRWIATECHGTWIVF